MVKVVTHLSYISVLVEGVACWRRVGGALGIPRKERWNEAYLLIWDRVRLPTATAGLI